MTGKTPRLTCTKVTGSFLSKQTRICAIAPDWNFADQIKSGQLTILNIAIAEESGERDFYVNLSDDHWSSLDPEWGKRKGKFETIKVRTERFDTIISRFGIPHYLKIDIEGGDLTVLHQLQGCPQKPQLISVEEHSLEYFPLLWGLGYRGFKIVNQGIVQYAEYPGWKFKPGTSGPFGDEAPGLWLPFGDAITDYMLNIRDCRDRELFTINWFDIHATQDSSKLPDDFPYPVKRSSKSTLRRGLSWIKRKALNRD